MSILKKIGLGRKSKLFGNTPTVSGQKSWVKWSTLTLFLVLLITVFPRSSFIEPTYKVGEPWRYDDLTAPFTFSLIKDKDELDSEKQKLRELTPPVFHLDHDVTDRVFLRLDSLISAVSDIGEQYHAYRSAVESSVQLRDSLHYMNMRNNVRTGLDDRAWFYIMNDYHRLRSGRNQRSWVGTELKMSLETVITRVLTDGVMDQKPGESGVTEVIIRDLKNRTERTLARTIMNDMETARESASVALNRSLSEPLIAPALALYDVVIQPNLLFNEQDTQTLLDEALEAISPTASAVAAGQVIIRKGDIITRDRMNMLQSLAIARAERSSQFEVWQQYVGQIMVIFAVVMVFFFYLYLYRRAIFDNNSMFVLVYLSMAIVLSVCAFVAHLDGVSPYLVPLAIAPILLTVIFDSRVGLMSTISVALLAGIMNGNDFEFVAATVTACSIAVFSVRDIKSRSQFFVITPFIVFLSYIVVMTGFSLIRLGEWAALGNQIMFVFFNSILIILTPPLILLFERLFRVTTDLTLFELNDTNSVLLKNLMMRAPGTFHHSLQVSNLSEAGAVAIGANALMCRVGSLYHDIGKMERPEYFVENQSGTNEHDKITPHMSALIIKSHVSSGINIAQEAKLPDVVIRFIRSHHGNSLIRYFFEKAKEKASANETIAEADYRYDGPLPATREEGIVMLADSVEASARTLKDPSYSRLSAHIDQIVNARVAEGQLSDCPLTFEDLKKIKEAFLTILVGVYHSRIKYPGQEDPLPGAQIPAAQTTA